MPKLDQKGIASLFLVAVIGTIIFIAITTTFSFKNSFFQNLYPKEPSKASATSQRGIYDSITTGVESYPFPSPATDPSIINHEFDRRINNYKAAGFTDLYLWIPNRYIEAILNPNIWGINSSDTTKKCRATHVFCQLATWDGIGSYIQKAKQAGLKVHVLYAPSEEKSNYTSTEVIAHPEWRTVFRDGTVIDPNAGPFSIDYAYDDMQTYEQSIILSIIARYNPTAIELEEPYYQTYPHQTHNDNGEVSYSRAFRDKMIAQKGYDPLPPASPSNYCQVNPTNKACLDCTSSYQNPDNNTCPRRADMSDLKIKLITTFIQNLRNNMRTIYPSVTLSVNWGGQIKSGNYLSEGFDIKNWLDTNIIDYASPQTYTGDVDVFKSKVSSILAGVGAASQSKIIVDIWPPYNANKNPANVNPFWLTELKYLDQNQISWNIFANEYMNKGNFNTLSNYLNSTFIGHWQFDENTGSIANDSSGNNFQGNLIHSPSWVTNGRFNGALSFNASATTRVEVADNPALNPTSLTVECWVSPSVGGVYRYCLSKSLSDSNNQYELYLTPQNRATFLIGQATTNIGSSGKTYKSISSTSTIPLNTWTHLAGTYDHATSTMKIYVNGIPEFSSQGSVNITNTGQPLVIGARNTASELAFTGLIDDVRIYNIARNQSQILADLNQGDIAGDIDGDGDIDIFDYGLFIADFNQSSGIALRSDINKDGIVNVIDYGIFVGNFGK